MTDHHDILDDEDSRLFYNDACPYCGRFDDHGAVAIDNTLWALCFSCSTRFEADSYRAGWQDLTAATVPAATDDDLIRYPPSGMSWPPTDPEAALIARYEAEFLALHDDPWSAL